MGCDIHASVERKIDGTWNLIDVRPPALNHRNYNVFAILADVRNGRGFAGIKTSEGFNPISEPRGLPPDISQPLAAYNLEGAARGDDDYETGQWGKWLGDHSFSWLLLREILEYDYEQTTVETGVLTIEEFLKLEAERAQKYRDEDLPRPGSWSGDISGAGIEIFTADAARAMIREQGWNPAHYGDWDRIKAWWGVKNEHGMQRHFIRDVWEIRYMQSMTHFIAGLTKYIKYGLDDVRLVFGFDS